MKWLIVLIILLLILAFVLARYRRQIMTGWQLWKMFRQMRQVTKPSEKTVKKKERLKEVQLVRCEKCGNWISPDGALKIGKQKFFCSSKCMERAAKLQSMVD